MIVLHDFDDDCHNDAFQVGKSSTEVHTVTVVTHTVHKLAGSTGAANRICSKRGLAFQQEKSL